MAKKRKAPSSNITHEKKPNIIHEEEEEEESSDEEEEEEEEESESESGSEEGDDEDEDEDEEDEASKRATVRELLEPFGKDQIIDLLNEAVSKDAKLMAKIIEMADTDPTHRKIFIHGLGYDATSEQLVQAFKPFGEIEESKLIVDKNTGLAKGYAFVLFKTRASAKKALKVPQKKIGSRNVSCQLAAVGSTNPATQASKMGKLKIFVGNVGPTVTPEKLKAFFRRYGEIEDGPIGTDPTTNLFKGFAVITYKSAEGYEKALEEPIKVFENCHLHCKKFVENLTNKNNVALQSTASNANASVTDLSYGGIGVNSGLLGTNLIPAGYLMSQNPGIGLAGNAMLPAGYNSAGLLPSGLSSSFGGIGLAGNAMLAAGYDSAGLLTSGLSSSFGGTGLAGNAMLAAGYNSTGSVTSGLSSSFGGMGSDYGMNSLSPSVMVRYGSQAAFNGMRPFRSSQTGHSTAVTSTTATGRDPGNVGKEPSLTSYFRR